ncbi:MAG: hypothetical protein CMJ74_01865 [Planctomycetaceae bacterium]|nr:hypothetical protein [Planctomycetaceae bacterium]|tara:strand:+ start:207 stop:593 length:387 start_codon:yes stop_codon:yes gene_type:complete
MQHTILKRAEQTFLALLMLAGLATMTGYWFFRVWHHGDLIEFDAAPPLKATFQIDINHADWPEMMQMPGVGKTTAQLIVKTREAGGPYTSLEDLANRVHGVGPRMTAAMKPFVLPTQTYPTPPDGQQP